MEATKSAGVWRAMKMKKLEAEVIESFKQKWLHPPTLVSKAPGRVNIIGEHTDYTGGYVLPVAINRSIVFAARTSESSLIRGYSLNYAQEASCTIGDYNPQHHAGWFRYVLGVLSELQKAGYNTTGFDFCISGDIPIGSGLSSSAALEMAVLTAMEALGRFRLSDTEAALLCQRAENNFIGVKCGIMDMLVSRIGIKNHAVFIDCSTLSSCSIEMDLPGFSWLVVDSGKRRGLVESEYNQRRLECEEALRIARLKFPRKELKNLRDITIEDLPVLEKGMSQTVYRRMRHVVTENIRVLEMVQAFEHKDLNNIGKLFNASHESLRYDFEVSCEELDNLVGITSNVDGVCGARLTGAGFGGCVILLAHNEALTEVRRAIRKGYHPAGTIKIKAKIFPIKVSDGAQVILTDGTTSSRKYT
jgi:galactokinase